MVPPGLRRPSFSATSTINVAYAGTATIPYAGGNGVVYTPLNEFLNRTSDENGNPKVVVGRLKNTNAQSLGIDINEEVLLSEKLDDLAVSNVDLTLFSEDFDVNNSTDYKIQQNNEESKRLLLKLERFRGLPTIRAQLNYGANTLIKLEQNNTRYLFILKMNYENVY